MKDINVNVLYDALKQTPFGNSVTTCKEITLFNVEDIKELESVRQVMSCVIKITDELISIYYLFICFGDDPDIFEGAKSLYNFIALENKQLFKIN